MEVLMVTEADNYSMNTLTKRITLHTALFYHPLNSAVVKLGKVYGR